VERDTLLITLFGAAIALGIVAALLWPGRSAELQEELPVTCFSDEQCGGDVELARFCDLGKLYASGQRNTCLRPGQRGSECMTTYDPWLLADSCEQ